MDIRDFVNRNLINDQFGFGLANSEETAQVLESVAAKIRSREYVLQRAECYDSAWVDEFTIRSLGITFAERRGPVAELLGPDSRFPIATAERKEKG